MPSFARREIVDPYQVGIYHCVARCVRRAFLCGWDALSGKSFDHRKQWVQQRLEELAALFAVDICGFAVLSNHLHLVLRTRPDVAQDWSDEEVACRWSRLFPRRDEQGRAIDIDSPRVRAEHDRFQAIRVRPDREFWTEILRIDPPPGVE
jgi:hypothetical protein